MVNEINKLQLILGWLNEKSLPQKRDEFNTAQGLGFEFVA